jgi:hypothetical protein
MISEYPQWVQDASAWWAGVKLYIETNFGSYNNLFHVILGPIVQILAALVLRKSVQQFHPWLVVLALELLNEAHDLVSEVWPTRYMQYGEGLKDIILTMLIPTIILLATRNFPHRFGMKPLRTRSRSR